MFSSTAENIHGFHYCMFALSCTTETIFLLFWVKMQITGTHGVAPPSGVLTNSHTYKAVEIVIVMRYQIQHKLNSKKFLTSQKERGGDYILALTPVHCVPNHRLLSLARWAANETYLTVKLTGLQERQSRERCGRVCSFYIQAIHLS